MMNGLNNVASDIASSMYYMILSEYVVHTQHLLRTDRSLINFPSSYLLRIKEDIVVPTYVVRRNDLDLSKRGLSDNDNDGLEGHLGLKKFYSSSTTQAMMVTDNSSQVWPWH